MNPREWLIAVIDARRLLWAWWGRDRFTVFQPNRITGYVPLSILSAADFPPPVNDNEAPR